MFPAFKNVLVPDYSVPVPPPPPPPIRPLVILQARRTRRSRRLSVSYNRRRRAFFRRMAEENRPQPVPPLPGPAATTSGATPSGGSPFSTGPPVLPHHISQASTLTFPPTPLSMVTTQPGSIPISSGQTTQTERFTPELSTQVFPSIQRPLHYNPYIQMPAVGQMVPSNSVARSLMSDDTYYSSPSQAFFSIPERRAVHPEMMDETPERIVVTGKHGRTPSQFIVPETPLQRPAKRRAFQPQRHRQQYSSSILNRAWEDFVGASYSSPHVEEIDSD